MLRSFVIVLGLTLSFGAFAATTVQDPVLTKSPDGKILKCDQASDVNLPGYKPTLFFVTPKNDGIEVGISLAAMTCKPNAANDGFEFAIRKMNDPMPSMALSGLPATLVFDHQDALLANRESDLLGSIEAANEMIQTFTYDLPLNKVLSVRESDNLGHGKAIHVVQTFLVRTSSHVETAYGRSEVQTSGGGSYILEFTVEKVGSKLRISKQTLR